MDFKEYKSANHWQRIRDNEETKIDIKDLSIFLLGMFGLFFCLWMC